MKFVAFIFILSFSLASCANTGSTVGNGLVSKSTEEHKEKAQKELVKKCEKLKGKVVTEDKVEYCLMNDNTKKELKSL